MKVLASQSCPTSWPTIAGQVPPSMGFSRQEYWSGLPFLSPGDLTDLGIEPWSPSLQAVSLPSEPPGNPKRDIRLNSKKHYLRTYYISNLLKGIGDEKANITLLKTVSEVINNANTTQ